MINDLGIEVIMMKIKWALNELRAKLHEAIKLEGDLSELISSIKDRSDRILDIADIHINGWLIVDSEDEFTVDATLTVEMTLPSTRSLEPVDITYEVALSETYISPGANVVGDSQAEDMSIELNRDILDLQKPIEDSILISLPTKVLTQDERESHIFPQGDNWQVLEEGNEKATSSMNEDSPFSALRDLFPEADEGERE